MKPLGFSRRRNGRPFPKGRSQSKIRFEQLESRNMLSVNISPSDVSLLLQRAATASSLNNAIIAVVDRDGDILGVKVESGVSVSLQGQANTPANDLAALVFSIDGAVAEELRGGVLFQQSGASYIENRRFREPIHDHAVRSPIGSRH